MGKIATAADRELFSPLEQRRPPDDLLALLER
jgi:hypothetical protein